MTQYGFFFDQGRCYGCKACSVACKDWYDIAPGPEKWMSVYMWEKGKFPTTSIGILAFNCGHCDNPVCVDACDNGAIFDGFPRTTPQAEAFDQILSTRGLKVDVMIYMDVPTEELVQRILLRGQSSGRADDANEEVIRNRIQIYNEQTAVVADYYSAQGKYEAVDGVGSLDEVFDRICNVIEKYL